MCRIVFQNFQVLILFLGFSCDVEFEKVDVVLRSANCLNAENLIYPCFLCFSLCFNMQSASFVLLLQGRSVMFVSQLEKKNVLLFLGLLCYGLNE